VTAQQVSGVRLKDMDKELFEIKEIKEAKKTKEIDETNNKHYILTMELLRSGRYLDEMDFENAEYNYNQILEEFKDSECFDEHTRNIVLSELFFINMIKEDTLNNQYNEDLNEIYPKVKDFLEKHPKNTFVKRIFYTYYLLIEKNPKKAEQTWNDFYYSYNRHVIKGSLYSEEALMKYVKKIAIEKGIINN
ncbi:MAG: hypothetical protein LBR24_00770, partial [Methanobrevibacter sp.]|nr:hypothetical protein [Methanobrevibacter sp.]